MDQFRDYLLGRQWRHAKTLSLGHQRLLPTQTLQSGFLPHRVQDVVDIFHRVSSGTAINHFGEHLIGNPVNDRP